MNKAGLIEEAMQLPSDERVQLGEEIWNSVIDDEQWMPTPEQLAEARRRLEEHRRNPSTAIPAERVLARVKSRFE
jgi:putative addiction module component (TIGR02574 family)